VHERSLARAILREVVAVRERRSLGTIRRVAVELGEFSGVEAAMLKSAFEEIGIEELEAPLALDIQHAPLESRCEHCQRVFRVRGFRFQCPDCGSTDVVITRGEELKLLSVDAEPAEAVR
jgi:hydrogenase nickel incorporation protein HypA/HybF